MRRAAGTVELVGTWLPSIRTVRGHTRAIGRGRHGGPHRHTRHAPGRWPMVRQKAALERYAALRCLWLKIRVVQRTNRKVVALCRPK
eukprot:1039634-Prymnesium_polylepis.1